MKTKFVFAMSFCLIFAACAKQGNSSSGPVGCPSSLPGAGNVSCAQSNGFIDAQICGADIHVVGNTVYISGSKPVSTTSNATYQPASDGYFEYPITGNPTQSCWFKVSSGALDPNASPPPVSGQPGTVVQHP